LGVIKDKKMPQPQVMLHSNKSARGLGPTVRREQNPYSHQFNLGKGNYTRGEKEIERSL